MSSEILRILLKVGSNFLNLYSVECFIFVGGVDWCFFHFFVSQYARIDCGLEQELKVTR